MVREIRITRWRRSGDGVERNESDRDNDNMERVPNPPAPNHQHHALATCEVPYKPPIGATSHSSNGPINHKDSPNPTTRHQLPTPTAHPELEQGMYEGYGTAYDPPTAISTHDNNLPNCKDA